MCHAQGSAEATIFMDLNLCKLSVPQTFTFYFSYRVLYANPDSFVRGGPTLL